MTHEPFYKQPTLVDVHVEKQKPLPEKIGPYQIEALIAKSHYSIIYLGYHPQNRQVVALKVLSPKFTQKEAMVSSFINEGTIIEMASHPNIVKLYDQGLWEGGLYIAMEFIRGVSLRQFIQQHSLSLSRCLDIILQVCYALCHLHTHGVIHGDLKPENILIEEDGEVKVLDFGIAKMSSSSHKNVSTAGTPSYMSPEHKINVHNLTYSSDIYSLGIIAYELITGKLCFGVIDLDHIPKNLRPIIDKCLKKSLLERYRDVVDLIQDLSQFFKQELKADKLDDPLMTKKDLELKQTLQEIFPLPQLHIDPLDFGFARQSNSSFCHPMIAQLLDHKGLLLGQIKGAEKNFTNSLIEAQVLGFIKYYFQETNPKKFSFSEFCQTLNTLCYEHNLSADFSLIYMDPYLDELHLAHGGLLAPIISKNKKLFIPQVGPTNPPLGTNLEPLSMVSHPFDLQDQVLIHDLKDQSSLDEFIKHYSSISSYSAQILTETLLKKSHSLKQLSSLICCLRVK
jgi:serine/threonine protein kinase